MNKESYLKAGERLDDLQRNGLYIIQDPEGFCFGMDAVLLSGFAAERLGSGKDRLLDLCTGNGIIALLLSAKTDVSQIVGMEIQPEVAEMAGLSTLTVYRFENGTVINFSLSTFLLLMKAVGCINDIENLMPEQPDSPYLYQRNMKMQTSRVSSVSFSKASLRIS